AAFLYCHLACGGDGQRAGDCEHAAADWLRSRRQPDEPVLVASPYNYFGIRYYLHDSPECYLFQQRVAHHDGAAVIAPQEMIGKEQLEAIARARFWAVNLVD